MRHDTDKEPSARLAAASGKAAVLTSHSVPSFEGAASRRHWLSDLPRLRRQAWRKTLAAPFALRECRGFVQFAGFPRSGHSLIGALIDAHPQARIAHELDAMGLLHKGMPARAIMRLCMAYSALFAQDGHWWNGFRYEVPGAPPSLPRPRVIGDKKGDWAMRWCAADPGLPDRLRAAMPVPCKWILVTRHPFDNVATMSLRQGRVYDRLRIAHHGDRAAQDAAIHRAQEEGEIAREIGDDVIADYRALAATVAQVKAQIAPEDWHEIVYEDFVADAPAHLEALAGFLGLDHDPAWTRAACEIVSGSAGQSRNRLVWRDDQRAALCAAIRAHDFLKGYRDDV